MPGGGCKISFAVWTGTSVSFWLRLAKPGLLRARCSCLAFAADSRGEMGQPIELEAAPDIPAYVAKRTGRILESEQVARLLPETERTAVRIEAVLPPGLSLDAAHSNWPAALLESLAGLPPLAQQAPGAITPPGLVRLSCACVNEATAGPSRYGYRGYFVSILISIPEACIWDVRLEEAK